MTTDVLSMTYGKPGGPGEVEVGYVNGLKRGDKLDVHVPTPGKGGKGGPAQTPENEGERTEFVDRGGAGGGRENLPIIQALKSYAESVKGTKHEPLYFLEPGDYTVQWSYDTSTATIVGIGSGGGGGGGFGEDQPGEDGEDGINGATFIFPTYLPVQRPR